MWHSPQETARRIYRPSAQGRQRGERRSLIAALPLPRFPWECGARGRPVEQEGRPRTQALGVSCRCSKEAGTPCLLGGGPALTLPGNPRSKGSARAGGKGYCPRAALEEDRRRPLDANLPGGEDHRPLPRPRVARTTRGVVSPASAARTQQGRFLARGEESGYGVSWEPSTHGGA